MRIPCFFSPDAADSADIQQAGNTIVSEGTRKDNRPFGQEAIFCTLLEIFKQRHLRS